MKRVVAMFAVVALLIVFCTGCSHHRNHEMTQLQIREIQTRLFEGVEAKAVLKEMVNVMQDSAFIVKNANTELGVLIGEKEVDLDKDGWGQVARVLLSSRRTFWKKSQTIELSANVTQFGKATRVRVNFQRRVLDNFGRMVEVRPIYDAKYYQEFFEKIHKGLFIQQEQI